MNLFDGMLASANGELNLQTGFGTYAIAPELKARLLANPKLGAGQLKVTCGIRPEDVAAVDFEFFSVLSTPVINPKAGLANGVVDLLSRWGQMFLSMWCWGTTCFCRA